MIEEQGRNLLHYLQANPIVAVVIGLCLLAMFYTRPKETFKLVAFGIFLVVVFYFITLFAGTVDTGARQKDQMIYKTKKEIGE